MPKSRGRKHSKSHRRTGPTSASWQSTILKAGRTLALPGTERVEAEYFASGLIGTVWSGRGLGQKDILDSWLDELLTYAGKRRTPEGAAVVAAFALVLEHAALEAALTEWAGDLAADLPWRAQPTPLPTRVTRSADVWDDTLAWFLEFEDTVLLVHTSRSDAGAMTGAAMIEPEGLALWDKEVVASDGDVKARAEVDTAQAVATLRSAQARTETTYPPSDEDGYVTLGHLLATRLAATGVAAAEPTWEPLSQDLRDEHLAAFFADLELELDDDTAAREIADLCLTYGEGYLGDDPLAWSPESVELFLLDWVPRKTFLDPEVQRLCPTVTYAFTGWAMVQRGVPKRWAQEAALVALELAEEFTDLYDETE